ncbi:DUF3558 domain-containing protein [Nocardia sp. NPDC023852]|uniref:DUF3558 domain-containing protein n=1 Tax=Nocardia sp. NPDC023852 TaxID=3154697 RepID=UPI00340E924D
MVALAGLLAPGTGCSQSTDGSATPSTGIDQKAATEALWDPCTQIGDEVLRRLDVDPASRDSGVGGVQLDGWKICSWYHPPGHDYSLTIYSTIFTVDDFKKKKENVDFVGVSVTGRSGWKFRRDSDKRNETCDLLFSAGGGSLQISFNRLSPSASVSPCDRATAAADVLVPLFPK